MGSFSIWHWLIVLLIVVLVFGTKRLRNVGKDLGEAVNEFKKGVGNKDEEKPGQLSDQSKDDAAASESKQNDRNAQ